MNTKPSISRKAFISICVTLMLLFLTGAFVSAISFTLISTGELFPPYSRPELTAIDTAADVGLGVAAIALAFFIAWYGTMHQWWKRPVGVAILAVFASLGGILALTLLSRISGGDYPLRDVIRLVTYWFVAASMLTLDVVAVRAFHRGDVALDVPKRGRRPADPEAPERIRP